MKEQIKPVTQAMENLSNMPFPSLGIDFDGCVDEAPIFFNVMTHRWPGKVFVVTYQKDRAKAEAKLAEYDIKYDELILVSSFDEKAEVIVKNNILIYFDDQPEMIKHVPPTVNVMLVRNEGNFCFEDKLWMLSDKTGKLV